MRVGQKQQNGKNCQTKKDLNQPQITSSSTTTGSNQQQTSQQSHPNTTATQASSHSQNTISIQQFNPPQTIRRVEQLRNGGSSSSSNNNRLITTTTSSTTSVHDTQAMTFGGADRSNLSLPTRRRHTTIDHAALSAAASNFLEAEPRRSENVMELLMTMLSPDTQRSFNDLSPAGFRAPALPAHHQSAAAVAPTTTASLVTTLNEFLETPTPTKIIYPKNVTEEQAKFVEGFNQALRQVQIQNQFANNQTPSLQSPSIANILLNLLTPTLNQPPVFPGTSNLSSPIDAAQVVVTNPSGTETVVQLSPTAPNSSSTATTLSPLSDNSLANPLPTLATATSSAAVAAVTSALATNTSVAATPSLSELVKQLGETSNSQNYMDIFNQQHSIGDLSAAVSFPQFINPQQSTSTSSTMLPPHLPQSSASAVLTTTRHNPAAIAIKSEPQNAPLHPSPPPQSLSVAVSTLAAIQNGYGGMHPQQQTNIMTHQPAPSTGRYNGHGHGVDMDDQERKKLERKRARNRAAASKCRQRKLERISELEAQVTQERQRNAQLQSAMEKSQLELQQLRQAIDEHRHAGCALPNSFN